MTENFKKFFQDFAEAVENEKATMKSNHSANDIDEMMGYIEYFLDTDPSNSEAINKINSELESIWSHCGWGCYDGPSQFDIVDAKENGIVAKELSKFAAKMMEKVKEYMSRAIDNY